MTFTDATILAALAALAVPLMIHLLGRRRAPVWTLPTVRFADGAHAASRGRRWLKSAALLAARLAVVALLVLALAGPYLAPAAPPCLAPGAPPYLAPGEYTGGGAAKDAFARVPPPVYSRGAKYDNTVGAGSPLRVLIVDAAGSETGRLRSADLVAATFAYEAPRQVARATVAQLAREALAAADVVFWVGPQAPPDAAALPAYLARGGAVVWVPGEAPQPPGPPLAAALGLRAARAEDVADGVTIDPGGYTSELVAAFEGGTGGDLGAPVFRRRLLFADAAAAITFRDGRAAIAEGRTDKGRTVALAAGPSPAWGDLAGRAEFVVLMHSLAEALAPTRDRTYLAPGEYTGGRTFEGAHDTRPPLDSRGAAYDKASAQASTLNLAPWLALAFVVVLAAESLLAASSARRANPNT